MKKKDHERPQRRIGEVVMLVGIGVVVVWALFLFKEAFVLAFHLGG